MYSTDQDFHDVPDIGFKIAGRWKTYRNL